MWGYKHSEACRREDEEALGYFFLWSGRWRLAPPPPATAPSLFIPEPPPGKTKPAGAWQILGQSHHRANGTTLLPEVSASDEATTSIAYAREADEWLEGYAPERFTVRDFAAWLAAKYGTDAINEVSVRGPLTKLEKKGRIVVERQGAGRAPTIFRKASQPTTERTPQ